MHTAHYSYQISEFVAVLDKNGNIINYGTIRQINHNIFYDNGVTVEVNYLIEVEPTPKKCPKTIVVNELNLRASPRPI